MISNKINQQLDEQGKYYQCFKNKKVGSLNLPTMTALVPLFLLIYRTYRLAFDLTPTSLPMPWSILFSKAQKNRNCPKTKP